MYKSMYAERSGMAYVVTKGTTMSSRQKVSSKNPRKRGGGWLKIRKFAEGFARNWGWVGGGVSIFNKHIGGCMLS